MIPAALELLLVYIDECRYLLQSSHSSHPRSASSAVPEYGRNLPVRQRKILDEAVNRYGMDLEKVLSHEFAKEEEKDGGEAANEVYPFAPETEVFILGVISGGANSELVEKHFSQFFDDPESMEYITAKVRLGSDAGREAIVGAALLPLIVSKAEEFLGAIVRTGLHLYPHALGEPPSVPHEILTKYQRNISSADIKRWQIDRQVAQLLKNSPGEWAKSIERWTKIDITRVGADWNIINEMIQRRHAVAHNDGVVDADYLAKVSSSLRRGLYPGSSLVCNSAYMQPVLIELETWAICLALRFSKRFFKEEVSIYEGVISRVTYLQGLGRWTQGLAIMESFLLEPIPLKQEDVILGTDKSLVLPAGTWQGQREYSTRNTRLASRPVHGRKNS